MDFAVSVLLCVAFNTEYYIALPCLCVLPFCFATYTCKLNIKIGRVPIWCMYLVWGLLTIEIVNIVYCFFWHIGVIIAPFFVWGMICIYYVFMRIEKKYDPIKYDEYINFESNNNNKYKVYITGKSEEIFEKHSPAGT